MFRPRIESMEDKVLLASISGQVYQDTNGGGRANSGGPGLQGWTVFLDADGNGDLDPAEITTTTDADGDYTFTGLLPGTYHVAEVVPSGWMQTTPAPAAITLADGTGRRGIDFGDFQTGTITGTVFDDQDGDGSQGPLEGGLSGVRVYLDQNQDGVLDADSTQVTAPDVPRRIDAGAETLTSSLLAGGLAGSIDSITVGLNITFPNDQDLDIALVSPWGARIQLIDQDGGSGADFTSTLLADSATASIASGTAPFSSTYKPGQALATLDGHDPNGNWMLEVTDMSGTRTGALDGWTLDFGTSEPVTTTDAQGHYSFEGLPRGTYTVRVAMPSGWSPTTPAPALVPVASSGATVTADVGYTRLAAITGTVFDDADGNGVLGPGEAPLGGRTVFLDQDDDGVLDTDVTTIDSADVPEAISDAGTALSALPVDRLAGKISSLTVNLSIDQPTDGDLAITLISPAGTPVLLMDREGDGEDLTGTVLSDTGADPISSGTAPFTGTFSPEQPLSTVKGQDPDGDWLLRVSVGDPSEAGTVIAWSITFTTTEPSTTTDADGDYTFTGLLPGTYTVRQAAVTGWGQTTADPAEATISTGGDTVAGIDFGSSRPFLTVPSVAPTTTAPELEEEVAVDPANPDYLVEVAGDYSLDGAYTTKYAYSTDGGSTWTESFVPLVDGSPATGDGEVWQENGNPSLAISTDGLVYMSDLYYDLDDGVETSNGVYVSVGEIGASGLQFTAADTFAVDTNPGPAPPSVEDKPWIAVDNSGTATQGDVYVAWTRFVRSHATIYFSRSTDEGRTWSTPMALSPSSQDGLPSGSQVGVGAGGEIYVVYATYSPANDSGGEDQLFLTTSIDGGLSFSAPRAITGVFDDVNFLDPSHTIPRLRSWPSLAVGADGDIYVAYAQQVGASADIDLISSTDGGSTFGAPVVVDDAAAGQRDEPAVAVAPGSGAVWVSWIDTRNHMDGSNYYDIYAAESTDDGRTFSPNVEVDQTSGYVGSAGAIGDYMGIAADDGLVHVVWTSGGHNTNVARLQTATLRAVPATIGGRVYEDVDADSQADAAEPGLQGWTVFLDADGDGVLEPGENSTTTDVDGDYSFTGLPPGTYHVTEVVPPGWEQTTPSPDAITLTIGTDVQGVDFGDFREGTISGTAFAEANGDGTGQVGLAGVRVILDQNQDGVSGVDSTPMSSPDVPQAIPAYADAVTSNLLAGGMVGTISSVTVQLAISYQEDRDLTVTLVSPWGAEVRLIDRRGGTGSDFIGTLLSDSAPAPIASGTAPLTGSFRPEQPLSAFAGHSPNGNWMLEISDVTGTSAGKLDGWAINFRTIEPVATSDADGDYRFTGLPPGTITVLEVAPSSWVPTTANPVSVRISTSGEVLTADFGNAPSDSTSDARRGKAGPPVGRVPVVDGSPGVVWLSWILPRGHLQDSPADQIGVAPLPDYERTGPVESPLPPAPMSSLPSDSQASRPPHHRHQHLAATRRPRGPHHHLHRSSKAPTSHVRPPRIGDRDRHRRGTRP